MASNAFSKPLVLEYKKRRYDGGLEIEMIEQIERRHQERGRRRVPVSVEAFHTSIGGEEVLWEGTLKPRRVKKSSNRLWSKFKDIGKALFWPGMQLFIGVFGIVLGALLYSPSMKNLFEEESLLRQEREYLFRQSWLVIRKGIVGTLCVPWTVLKACF